MEITPQHRRAKADVEAQLLAIEGVTGVGLGEKVTKNERTGRPCIRVYVSKKQAKSKLKKADVIPETINGMETDVIERVFELQSASVPVAQLAPQVDAGTYNPLTGGIGIGPCRTIGGSVFVGTLGLVVEDVATGDPMMLSNFHVMCVDGDWSAGDRMTQPSRVDGGSCPGGEVGELTRAQLGPQVDAAVARIDGRPHNCDIHEIGEVAGTALAVDGEPVRKRGRTTELTHGFVDDVALTVTIDYGPDFGDVTLTNQIGVTNNSAQNAEYSQGGDSGSVVVNADNEVIGLHFAGTSDGAFGVANPIAEVLSALNVRLCSPSPVVTTPWDDITTIWDDHKAPWETTPWRDLTLAWNDIGGGFTNNKRFDDVKNPAGYDTMMETVHEGIDTLRENVAWGDPGLIDPGPAMPGRPGLGDPRGGGPATPFVMSTPHHAEGASRFDAASGDLAAELAQLKAYLAHLESRLNGNQ